MACQDVTAACDFLRCARQAAAPVSMALHTPLTLRGETSPCSEPCDDHDALPEPLKAVVSPHVKAAMEVGIYNFYSEHPFDSCLALAK